MERVRLVDWLKSERDQHVGGGLYYNSQILFAYNSNHMEGSTLSPEQTAQLFNTGALLPDNINDEIRADDVAETTNHFNAFNWALVVPEFLRTLVFARPRGDDQFADCTFSPSLDMSR